MDLTRYFKKAQPKDAEKQSSGDQDDDDFQSPVRPPLRSKERKRKPEEEEKQENKRSTKKQKQSTRQEIDPRDFFAAAKKLKKSQKAAAPATTSMDIDEHEVSTELPTKSIPEKNVKVSTSGASTAQKKTALKDVNQMQPKETSTKEVMKEKSNTKHAAKEPDAETSATKHTVKEIKQEASSVKIKETAAENVQESSSKEKTTMDNNTESTKKREEKKHAYRKLLTREGPRALGTRPLPIGKENCFEGMTFVFSGELDTMTRDTAQDIVKRYGGRVTNGVSGKTTYLICGRDAGESKTAKAQKFGTKIVDEDGFYKLVENTRPVASPTSTPVAGQGRKDKGKAPMRAPATNTENATQSDQHLPWTEKYRPKTIGEIMGNKELVKRLSWWLENWESHRAAGFVGSKDNDGISGFRAVLLSGPPGIGKTTAAHVIAKTHGYEVLEFNASDVRSKKALEDNINEMVDNRTLTEFYKRGSDVKTASSGKKVVLIMDEVDGMTTGDKGGAVELATLIKKTKIPIICICNDIRSQKVQPLTRVCYDARFKRTPANQLRSRIMTIAFREKLKISPNAIDQLVEATHNDIRQIINILSTYRLGAESMDYDQAKLLGKQNEKNVEMNIFDVPGTLFNSSSWRSLSLAQKSDVYFEDYSLTPLMVFENYTKYSPDNATSMAKRGTPAEIACNEMRLIADAAEAIADGDLVDAAIHGSTQQYSLMPVQSIFSCVRPASFMHGTYTGGRLAFPSWLGQNSKAGKYARMLNDMRRHMGGKISANRPELRQNYVPTLSDRLFDYLKQENLEKAMELLDTYGLGKECLETLSDLDLSTSGSKKPYAQLPAKVKRAFTRLYNSTSHPTVFAAQHGEDIRKVKGASAAALADDAEEDIEMIEDIEEDLEF